MPGVVVDGQDVVAVYRATLAAVDRARAGHGPTLIEAKTYRFHEHAYGLRLSRDYIEPETVQGWREDFDPLVAFQRRLTTWGALSSQDQEALRAEVEAEVEAAVAFARDSPFPTPDRAYVDIYAEQEP